MSNDHSTTERETPDQSAWLSESEMLRLIALLRRARRAAERLMREGKLPEAEPIVLVSEEPPPEPPPPPARRRKKKDARSE